MNPVLAELHDKARAVLDPVHYDFFAGGVGDEVVLAANEAAFRRLALLPRVLRGKEIAPDFPVLLSPTAFHRLAHPDGELATARALDGTTLVSSMASTVPIADVVAAATGPVWFQLYLQPDQDVTRELVRRAERAGCRALVVTADSPVFGRHRRDLAHGFHDLPPGLAAENMRDLGGVPLRNIEMSPALSWDDVDRLRETTSLPLWVKGVLHPRDAEVAIGHGAAGIIVSNHGGRQLDLVPASLDALPAVLAAVAGRVPVVLDGGVRSGGDIALAIALGASAAGIGRPVLWGLAAGGDQGVRRVLDVLRDEYRHVLTMCGGELTPDMVVARC
ncbi:alpha-hydroxy acid oxidase [Lentzea sp. NBRC 102530]|uniref:alpha-hydroxy acid oxidase n=1 Tax=Lentzea sp. NBRC 102530 TaxID=3032201 RepID=UPI0024A5E3D9|nr:alpha-hydroxy acid oxidase [Lentzea sp. NBRC 102530]GLY50209.1 alpha-hydroxy-acid oxidizing enzyme [Lentzea sp. NBRC 102530]